METPPNHDAAAGRPDGQVPRLRFPKAARLTRAAQFTRVRLQGRTVHGRWILLGVLDAKTPDPAKTGIVTSRKVGGAVVRNKVRRRLREIVRHSRPRLRDGLWLVLVAKSAAAKVASRELAAEWSRLAEKARIFKP